MSSAPHDRRPGGVPQLTGTALEFLFQTAQKRRAFAGEVVQGLRRGEDSLLGPLSQKGDGDGPGAVRKL
ncbi:hypothetical protein ABZX77_29780 [Streptomyces sp. NPDC004237]|uniref:hypothetical protein n=1 Tax=Streptomyces sp. NPDC004237 TaxID=3154455 RepID=UPI0033B5261A